MTTGAQSLYGGHFSIELINGSENYVDASTVREVPDNQEVFVGKNDDASVIIDILEEVDAEDLEAAMTEHLDDVLSDLATAVIEKDDTVVRKDSIKNGMIISKLTIEKAGSLAANSAQETELFKESEPLKQIHMYIGLVRLKEHETDILVTYNPPQRSHDENVLEAFERMLQSLALKDPSIFG